MLFRAFRILITVSVVLAGSVLAQESVTLRIMHWAPEQVEGTAWWDEIIQGFEETHSGVTIESNFLPFAQYLPTLEAMTAASELPDVFFGHVKAAELGRAGLAVNYREVFDDTFFERFYPGPLRQFTFGDGEIYALPWSAQMFGIFANDTIMAELALTPPETWDQLIEMAPAIQDAGYIPLAWGNAARNVCPDFVLPLVTQYGGDVYALDALSDTAVSWDSQPVVEALTLLQRLVEADVFAEGINGVTEEQGWQLAFQGRAAMLYTGSWVPAVIEQQAPPEFAENYSVHKNPALTEDAVHWSGNGSGEGWVVKEGPNRELALELVEYLLSDETYKIYTTGAQTMPSMPMALEFIENEKVKEMTSWLTTDGANHILFGQGSWEAISNVCQGILDGSVAPEEGAAQIQADVMATRSRTQ